MNNFFSNYYDIKEIKRDIDFLTGGLSKIAKELDVERIGTMHHRQRFISDIWGLF